MELHDPVAIYLAASNLEAHQIAGALHVADIASHVIEDNDPRGVWLGGLNSIIHKPRIWVSTSDRERAEIVIRDFELANQERRIASQAQVTQSSSDWIDVCCEKCGEDSRYPIEQNGTVQNCPICYAFVDVGSEVEFHEWDTLDAEEIEPDTDASEPPSA